VSKLIFFTTVLFVIVFWLLVIQLIIALVRTANTLVV
jgi:hypothetical protein